MDEDSILEKISVFSQEHRDLDDAIELILRAGTFDALQVQRMKKRKLMLKDEVEKLQSLLLPDIIA
ncbi:MAG: DUF465 domain-containing protein [Kordiimonadaceae bacterium]|nr:DUF465 domain-containing protein [Kordiimonadaceae bacterium]MBV1901561.1 DUF465 domain-containing protein [Kordiimonadaceae bacterium]